MPSKQRDGGGGGQSKGSDLNKATLEELERTPQMDSKRAQALISKREELGGFKSWEDVEAVPGFSTGMIQNLKDANFTLGKAA